jgi:hypothetical protein
VDAGLNQVKLNIVINARGNKDEHLAADELYVLLAFGT